MIDMGRWYTVAEIGELLQVHEQSVRRWLRSGEMKGTLLGRKGGYRVAGADLKSFMDERSNPEGKEMAA